MAAGPTQLRPEDDAPAPARSLSSVAVWYDAAGRSVVAARGIRAAKEARDFPRRERHRIQDPVWGTLTASGLAGTPLAPRSARIVEVELVDVCEQTRDQAAALLCTCMPSALARELLDVAIGEPTPDWADWDPDVPPAVAAAGGKLVDLWVPELDGPQAYFRRRLMLAYSDRWVVALYGPPIDCPGRVRTESSRDAGMPGHGGAVRHPRVEGDDAAARAARHLQRAVGHTEWKIQKTAWKQLEQWENRFMSQAATGTTAHMTGDIAALRRELAHLGGFATVAARCARTIARRAEFSSAIPDVIRDDLKARGDELEAVTNRYRAALRESFHLVASVAAAQQLHLAQRAADNQQIFQIAAAFITGVVLVPGLVAAIYGANVGGLPGGEGAGLRYMIYGSVGGAVLTIVILLMTLTAANRRSQGERGRVHVPGEEDAVAPPAAE